MDLALAEAKKKQSEARALDRARRLSGGQMPREEVESCPGKRTCRRRPQHSEGGGLARGNSTLNPPRSGRRCPAKSDALWWNPAPWYFVARTAPRCCTTVTCFDPIGLTFDILEGSFLHYQRFLREQKVKGAGSRLRLAVAEQEGFPIEGTLESFEDHADPQSGTVGVHGSVPNPDRLLLPGMFARVQMTVGPPRALLGVPRGAIQFDQDNGINYYVLVVNDCKVVERRAVSLAPEEYGTRLIEKGLRPEDWVVVAGLAEVRPGDRVAPQKKATADH